MARALGGHALDLAARKVSFTLCGDYIWARVSGRRGTRDILFPLKNARESEACPAAEFGRLEQLPSPADISRGRWHNVTKTLLGRP
jgi:hypothetical protein